MTENKRYQPINLGSPGEDISKKDLHAITQRFKNLNQLRQQRAQDFLQPRQQVFLHSLPLLFHQNNPLFPGFVSSDTPAGIADYIPNKQAIHTAKTFSKNYTFKRRALVDYPIHSIFLMGSISSIAFSKNSDMDVWLCHKPSLSPAQLDELQEKATLIEQWADSYDLEVHFFLVNSEQFCQGDDIPISAESSGTTQHYLLLEEFYRTAIFIAGRIPAWWLVPPHQEQHYSAYLRHLIDNRFISEHEIINFGGLEYIPAEEFITATLWHIYKSLTSPHKSLLKLFLMECYANEYPHPQWLSYELKEAIYKGTFDLNKLDPYLLIYLKIEKHLLQENSTHRLNLVRHCFYLKIMGSSSKDMDYKSRLLRENYIQTIADQNSWPEELLQSFNKHKYWDIKKAVGEHSVIRTQLKHSLRMILGIAGKYVNYNYRENKDLKLIGRKLHTFLERKPGKVEIITTRSTVHNKENTLSIIEEQGDNNTSSWSLYSGKYDKTWSKHNLIKEESNFLALLSWLVINGLYQKQLQFHLQSDSLTLSKAELNQILDQLFLFISKNLHTMHASLDIYNKADSLQSSLVFFNLGKPHINERDDGMLVLSDRSDPFSYGQNRLCFIQVIDRISISRWGEVSSYQDHDLNGFFHSITDIFNRSSPLISIDSLNTLCYTPIRANSITQRAELLFENLIKFFSAESSQKNVRYFLPGKAIYYVFKQQNDRLSFLPLDTTEQLLDELASSTNTFSDVHFDAEILENTIIPYLYTLNQAFTIQVFFTRENGIITIYIIDENGALFFQEHLHSDYHQVLTQYSVFLESILNHSNNKNDLQLTFHEIHKKSSANISSKLATWTPTSTHMDLSLRITLLNDASKKQKADYHIYCNDIEFNSFKHGQHLFKEVAHYILNFRKDKNNYPIHISDIEAPFSFLGVHSEDQLQTIHFLKYKRKIESKLNAYSLSQNTKLF